MSGEKEATSRHKLKETGSIFCFMCEK